MRSSLDRSCEGHDCYCDRVGIVSLEVIQASDTICDLEIEILHGISLNNPPSHLRSSMTAYACKNDDTHLVIIKSSAISLLCQTCGLC